VLAENVLSSPSQAADPVFTRSGPVKVSIRAQRNAWTGAPLLVTIAC
jgi:hypothetical protein